jgi:hypothetical protein
MVLALAPFGESESIRATNLMFDVGFTLLILCGVLWNRRKN